MASARSALAMRRSLGLAGGGSGAAESFMTPIYRASYRAQTPDAALHPAICVDSPRPRRFSSVRWLQLSSPLLKLMPRLPRIFPFQPPAARDFLPAWQIAARGEGDPSSAVPARPGRDLRRTPRTAL